MINIFKKSYKYYQDKIYGIGLYKQLLEYSKNTKENIHTRIFLSPFKADKLNLIFAIGLDSY